MNRVETLESSTIELPKKTYQVYNISSNANNVNMNSSTTESQGSILVSMYNNTNGRRANSMGAKNHQESLEMGNAWTQPRSNEIVNSNIFVTGRSESTLPLVNEKLDMKSSNQSLINSNQSINENNFQSSSLSLFTINRIDGSQSRPETSFQIRESQKVATKSSVSKDWSRIYLFGKDLPTDVPATSKQSE